ncbi:DUF1097 domain-containing protein [Vibrio sp. ZSDE26]|uniref:DUF1097 domain-containing protein n=1 Tax=Vibrio amylolyticus TaxID=2847292 RepID=A0A9X2BIB5_9VIBR|nr:DUF1097 domain-containing protein [Vibrio amylolyticus]MCK6263915.1 DUF1097 domain-containing protein [Vibrio amylolyticus]
MSVLVAISLTTGVLSGIWGWVSISLGLLSWAGFLGCTSYFASPNSGLKGLAESLITNITGVFWALVIIYFSSIFSIEIIGYIATAVVAFFMCIQAKQTWLSYIPGTFIGSCATFAANGNWQLVVPSIVLGGIFGYLMKASGLWLHNKLNQRSLVTAR